MSTLLRSESIHYTMHAETDEINLMMIAPWRARLPGRGKRGTDEDKDGGGRRGPSKSKSTPWETPKSAEGCRPGDAT